MERSSPSPAPEKEAPRRSAILFSLSREFFAIPLNDVGEICEMEGLTPVPLRPPFLSGVVNIHGRLSSVIHMGRVLGVGGGDKEGRFLIVLVPERGALALRVDACLGIARFSVLERIVREGGGEEGNPVEGVFRSGGKLVSLISPEKLLMWIDRNLGKGEA